MAVRRVISDALARAYKTSTGFQILLVLLKISY